MPLSHYYYTQLRQSTGVIELCERDITYFNHSSLLLKLLEARDDLGNFTLVMAAGSEFTINSI
ncbi:MAG: hypothetical protein J07HQX50_01828 [Haloquadratum sp. J07HQX50]|nr:MAG: hypothetical protein J07HQX50_01828 [Haloquadratum sp. J07HQX50]